MNLILDFTSEKSQEILIFITKKKKSMDISIILRNYKTLILFKKIDYLVSHTLRSYFLRCKFNGAGLLIKKKKIIIIN